MKTKCSLGGKADYTEWHSSSIWPFYSSAQPYQSVTHNGLKAVVLCGVCLEFNLDLHVSEGGELVELFLFSNLHCNQVTFEWHHKLLCQGEALRSEPAPYET